MSVSACEYMFIYLKEPDVPRSGNQKIPLNWLDPGKIEDMVLESPKDSSIT